MLLTGAYLALSLAGRIPDPLLISLLGLGGLGLGCGFSAQLANLSAAVPSRLVADLSGLITTTGQVAAVVGVAAFGTGYLAIVGARPTRPAAVDGFATVTLAFATAALLAAVVGYLSIRPRGTEPAATVEPRAVAATARRR